MNLIDALIEIELQQLKTWALASDPVVIRRTPTERGPKYEAAIQREGWGTFGDQFGSTMRFELWTGSIESVMKWLADHDMRNVLLGDGWQLIPAEST